MLVQGASSVCRAPQQAPRHRHSAAAALPRRLPRARLHQWPCAAADASGSSSSSGSGGGSSTSTAVSDSSSEPSSSPGGPRSSSSGGGGGGSGSLPPKLELTISLASGMRHVGQEEWDACAAAGAEVNPFLLHAFLATCEDSGSAVKEEGWLPQHVLVRDAAGTLLGCCPMYLKAHSYGEYVFDQSWANAYHNMMRRGYYPKLLVGVPFTPVPGPRLLVRPGPQAGAVRRAMADSLKQIADQLGVSSLHINFCTRAEWEELGGRFGYQQRLGLQYHWYNTQDVSASLLASVGGSLDSLDDAEAAAAAAAAAAGLADAPPGSSSGSSAAGQRYASFDEGDGSFLLALRQSKRKSIRQERRKAAGEGLRFRRLRGGEVSEAQWDAFYDFYLNTTDRKWGQAYLTRDFFRLLGARMPDRVLLVLAETAGGEPVAGALNLQGSHALFGRNWGCKWGDRVPNLHFELCYYQALEHAIAEGLQRVEAGAQGEHKIQRGYVPSLTYSLHYLAEPAFAQVVGRYLGQERAEMEYTLRVLQAEASPYRQ